LTDLDGQGDGLPDDNADRARSFVDGRWRVEGEGGLVIMVREWVVHTRSDEDVNAFRLTEEGRCGTGDTGGRGLSGDAWGKTNHRHSTLSRLRYVAGLTLRLYMYEHRISDI